MNYLVMLGLLVVILPVVFIFMTRRGMHARQGGQRDHGLSVDEPSSDQPSAAGGTVNRGTSATQRRTPPG